MQEATFKEEGMSPPVALREFCSSIETITPQRPSQAFWTFTEPVAPAPQPPVQNQQQDEELSDDEEAQPQTTASQPALSQAARLARRTQPRSNSGPSHMDAQENEPPTDDIVNHNGQQTLKEAVGMAGSEQRVEGLLDITNITKVCRNFSTTSRARIWPP